MKKIFYITLLSIVAFCMVLTGCTAPKAIDFTEEEHLKRVTELVEARYMKEDSKYTSYTVFPLYTENDELGFFLIEFKPYGFVYVKLNEEAQSIASAFGATPRSLYTRFTGEGRKWQRYTMDGNEKKYEVDENGEQIFYQDSHFKVAGIENERRYLLRKDDFSFIPAVKRDNKYINLVSMEEMYLSSIMSEATANISFMPKSEFNL